MSSTRRVNEGQRTAQDAWCGMNLGKARLVKLKGITHRTGFFREVARALGVARGSGLSPGKIQILEMMQRAAAAEEKKSKTYVLDPHKTFIPKNNGGNQ